MTRYIDADTLSNVMADRLALVSVKCGMDSARAMEAAKAMAIVNAQPTIDAIPIEWIMRYAFDGKRKNPISITKMIADWREENGTEVD